MVVFHLLTVRILIMSHGFHMYYVLRALNNSMSFCYRLFCDGTIVASAGFKWRDRCS